MRQEFSRQLSESVECKNIVEWAEVEGSAVGRKGFDGASVRFTPKLLAEIGVDRLIVAQSDTEARVERTGGLTKVYLRSNLNELDSRALLAHEIGHVLLARNKRLSDVIRRQKLEQDPDVEELVDWLAQALLVPQENVVRSRSPDMFAAGFSLAARWSVRPRMAFTRLLKFIGRDGDLCFSFSVRVPNRSQMSLFEFEEPAYCRFNWALSLNKLPWLDGANTYVERVRGASLFRLDRKLLGILQDGKYRSEDIVELSENITFARLLSGKTQVRSTSQDQVVRRDNLVEEEWSNFVIWCS